MRVQSEGQELRLRIYEAELAELLGGKAVENRVHWPDGRTEMQKLRLAAAAGWSRDADGWRLELPEAEVRALAARLPSREGLHVTLPGTQGDSLNVLFDVDVRDSARQRHTAARGKPV